MTRGGDKGFSANCLGELDRLCDGVPYAELVRIGTDEKAQGSTAFSR